ncbi:uncharacterized, partial [Tachysurus ichikawai]
SCHVALMRNSSSVPIGIPWVTRDHQETRRDVGRMDEISFKMDDIHREDILKILNPL